MIAPDVRGLHPFYEELSERFASAGVHAIAFDYFGRTYAYAIDRIGAVVRRARRWLERVSGGALTGLGVRLALDRR